jgi:hypothetical protein
MSVIFNLGLPCGDVVVWIAAERLRKPKTPPRPKPAADKNCLLFLFLIHTLLFPKKHEAQAED